MLFYDLCEYTIASSYYKIALRAAQEAENDDLQAYLLGRMKTVNGNAQEALPRLQKAQYLAKRNSLPTLCSWLACQEAEAQAELENAPVCFEALKNAEDFVDHIQAGEDPYAIGFTRLRLLEYRGSCSMRLRKPKEAQAALKEILRDSKSIFSQSILIHLTNTSIQQEEIEEACNFAYQALEVIKQTKSARNLQRLLALRPVLDSWNDTQYVKDLDERMAPLLVPNGYTRR
jgi:tetratricopeptide (TPR) repeat protein